MPKLVALPVRGYPDIYVNPTRVTLIRESGEAETLVEFEGDKREAIALPIEKVRELKVTGANSPRPSQWVSVRW